MKKLLQIILAVAIVCSSLPIGVFANDGRISVGPLDFDQATTADDIANVITDNGSLFGAEYVILNANGSSAVIEPHNWNNDAGATDIDKQFGTSVAIKNISGWPGIKIMATNVGTENIVTEFSIKKKGTDKTFYCNYISGGDNYVLAFGNNGYVRLCNNDMVKYESDTWYDVKLVFNPKKVYTRLYLKKHGENDYKTYDAFFFYGCDGKAAKNLSGGISQIDLGYLSNGEETTYIDNVSYYTKGVGDVVPSMSSLNDDFSNAISTFDKGNFAVDYAKQWRVENRVSTLNFSTKKVDGKRVLVMNAESGWPLISKLVRDLPEDSTSIIKFGLGRASETTGMYLYFNETATDVFSLSGKNLQVVNSQDSWGGFDAGKISNLELVINRKQKIARVILNTNGRIYMSDLKKFNFDRQIGSIDFMMPGAVGAELYLSDFQYDMLDDNSCKLERAYLESGYSDNSAALDDKIVFEFNQSVAYKFVNGIETIPCTLVAADGSKVECTATMSLTEWNKVIVTPLETLKPNTKYTVEVSGVQGGYDEGTTSANYTFTTAADEFSFAKPVIASDGTITLDAKAYVNQEKPAVLIAAAYDADGNCVEVQYTDIVAKKTNSTISFKPNFSADHKSVSAFVWSDFSAMTPYSEHSESN